MSKEMTPLEAFRRWTSACLSATMPNGYSLEQARIDKEIIETALKRLELLDTIEKLPMPEVEVLDNNKISYVGHDIVITDKEQFDKDQKKLKALEIIKEKVMPLVSLDEGEIHKGHYRIYDGELYGYTELTKEEFDLLKEVLL